MLIDAVLLGPKLPLELDLIVLICFAQIDILVVLDFLHDNLIDVFWLAVVILVQLVEL